ncbi:unnamed protein product [Clonostachys rhizophaga]|uniref:Uncharacterized protein n=1 Tax=Clonostachys rhizophaga TaxID=160324 RepID=A0A9N9VG31_9HYPO|nr:unnamed protein product [Clonostachys rhizophaga]
MPVTVFPTNNSPTLWEHSSSVKTAEELLKKSCPEEAEQCTKVLESSLNDIETGYSSPDKTIEELLNILCPEEAAQRTRGRESLFNDLETGYIGPSCNGFVHAVCEAYSGHHHLNIRPDDVWLSILVQLSFYFDRNGDKFRYMLEVHEGWRDVGATDYATMEEAELGGPTPTKTKESETDADDADLQNWENWDNDVDLRKWIRLTFTTTWAADHAIALAIAREFGEFDSDRRNSIMPDKLEVRHPRMDTRQPYFNYGVSYGYGLPSVTLLGEREDWDRLRGRLWEIATSRREEVERFADQLETVLDNFVNSFDNPTGSDVIRFWNDIVYDKDESPGTRYLSGWLSKFCFWSEEGEEIRDYSTSGHRMIDTKRIPRGFASVVEQKNNKGETQSVRMLAGSIGHHITRSGDLLDQSGSYRVGPQPQTGLDSVQPVTGWWKCERRELSPAIEE